MNKKCFMVTNFPVFYKITIAGLTSMLFLTSYRVKTDLDKGFIIHGNIKNLRSDSVYLYNTLTSKITSAPVSNNKFSFAGQVFYPEMYQVYYDTKMNLFTNIFLENSEITLWGSIDSVKSIIVEGSKSQDEFLTYRNSIRPLSMKANLLDNAITEAQNKNNEEAADSLQALFDSVSHLILEQAFNYALANKNSVILPYITSMASLNAPDSIFIEKIFDVMDKSLINNPRIEGTRNLLRDFQKTAVGKNAPDFEIKSFNGGVIQLSAYKGKIVLLDFWASWCQPCIEMFPELLAVLKKYGTSNVQIISFSIDKSEEAWKKALIKYKLPWPQVVDLSGVDGTTPKNYGIIFIPTSLLIDKQGRIAAKNLRGKKLAGKISELSKL
jgi:thiol-disulfide isomerase/thioredoxin